MEYASIEREIHIDAPPEVVFDVISQPEHVRQWWNADTDVAPTPGAAGELVWADGDNPRAHVTSMAVVAVEPPRLFRERGWEIAALEQRYHEHENGWDTLMPRIAAHAVGLVSAR